MEATYRVMRFAFSHDPEVVAEGLTLEEAQDHCNDPETSSSTASDETLAEVWQSAPWFDGYTEE